MKLILISMFQLIIMNTFAQLQPVSSGVFHLADMPVKKEPGREGRKIAEGTTPEFGYFEIHATTQEKGAKPKPPHAQKDIEELIIIKEGSMKCTIGDRTTVLGAGSIMIIPPLEMQAFENVGDGQLSYYVLQFRSRKPMDMERSANAGGTLLLNADTLAVKKTEKGSTQKYFDRATAMCERYEMHITGLNAKGPSHTPHQHVETEIILVLEGDMEMDINGQHYNGAAGDLFIAESGKMHGVGNAADKPCRYFAFKWR